MIKFNDYYDDYENDDDDDDDNTIIKTIIEPMAFYLFSKYSIVISIDRSANTILAIRQI
jgi:hypothetical protein